MFVLFPDPVSHFVGHFEAPCPGGHFGFTRCSRHSRQRTNSPGASREKRKRNTKLHGAQRNEDDEQKRKDRIEKKKAKEKYFQMMNMDCRIYRRE